jgi:hypothetical protein
VTEVAGAVDETSEGNVGGIVIRGGKMVGRLVVETLEILLALGVAMG